MRGEWLLLSLLLGCSNERLLGTVDEPKAVPPCAPPLLLAPLSTQEVSSSRPELRFRLANAPSDAGGADVEICQDRACDTPLQTLHTRNTSIKPAELPPGVFFWRVRSSSGSCTSATWEAFVPRVSSPAAWAGWPRLDTDGDGEVEFAVGSPGTLQRSGSVAIYSGMNVHNPRVVLPSPGAPGGEFAPSFVIGDVNGDGYGDLLVGAPSDGAGSAFLYLGGSSGPTWAETLQGPVSPGALFGLRAAGVGDVNDDGFGDVAISAQLSNGSGQVYLFTGTPLGVSPSPTAAWSYPGTDEARFGSDLALVPAVSATPSALVISANSSSNGMGSVWTFAGWGLADPTQNGKVLLPTAGSRRFGVQILVSDRDGDGTLDLAVGAPETEGQTGRVELFRRSATGWQPSAIVAGPDGEGSLFGWTLGRGGEVNGDGLQELLVGAWGKGAGALHVLSSDVQGGVTTRALVLPSQEAGAQFGKFAVSPGDLDGDGYDDVVVGAPLAGGGSGQVLLFRGGPLGLAALPVGVIYGEPQSELGTVMIRP